MDLSLTNPGLVYDQSDPSLYQPTPRVRFFKNNALRNQQFAQDVHSGLASAPLRQTSPQTTTIGTDANGNPITEPAPSFTPAEFSSAPGAVSGEILPPTMDTSGDRLSFAPPVLPKFFRPSYQAAVADPTTGLPTNAFSPGLSKAGKLITVLAALGRGAASGAGQPNFGAGFQAGTQRPLENAALAQEIPLRRAQIGLAQAESSVINIPGVGPVPVWLAKTMGPAWLRMQGVLGGQTIAAGSRENVAQTQAGSREKVAGTQVAGKLSAIGLQTEILRQKGGKFLPDVDANGQPFYHVMNPFGQEIGQADVNVIPSLMTRTSNTLDFQAGADGNLYAIPKTTTTGPVLPRGAAGGIGIPGPAGGGGFKRVPLGGAAPLGGGAGAARLVTNAKPVAGPGGKPLTTLAGQKVNDAANAEQIASQIMNSAGGDPDKALQLFDQKSGQVTDPQQQRLGPMIRKAIRGHKQINSGVDAAIDRIIGGDINGGLQQLQQPQP
jgi:hypothetical protein